MSFVEYLPSLENEWNRNKQSETFIRLFNLPIQKK